MPRTTEISQENANFRQVIGTTNVWRSDAAYLSTAECLANFKGATVIDLRGDNEKTAAPVPSSYTIVKAVIPNFNKYQNEEEAASTIRGLASAKDHAKTMATLYGQTLSRQENKPAFITIISTLYSTKGKVIIVDNGGKDRVGVISALISKAMGESDEDIFADYEESGVIDEEYKTSAAAKITTAYGDKLGNGKAIYFLDAPKGAIETFFKKQKDDIDHWLEHTLKYVLTK